MMTATDVSSRHTTWILLLAVLVLCLSEGCSKSITSIGPFEGYWSGDLGSYLNSGYSKGMIQFEVSSDRSVEGYGEVWFGFPTTAKAFELDIEGMVNPNGSLECRYQMRWVHPTIELKSYFPQGYGNHEEGSIGGYLNPALNYGTGSCLTGKKEKAWVAWTVHRQK